MSLGKFVVRYSQKARLKKQLGLTGWLLMTLLSLHLVLPATSQANGGTPIFNGDSGPFNVYLILSPTPPTPNVPVHFSLLLLQRGTSRAVTTATVILEPSMPGMEMPGVTRQRFLQAQGQPNRYELDVPLTMEGQWRFNITIVDPLGQTSFVADAKVEKPDAPWPIIIAILLALPTLAGLTWWFLFRGQSNDEGEDEDGDEEDEGNNPREVKVGT